MVLKIRMRHQRQVTAYSNIMSQLININGHISYFGDSLKKKNKNKKQNRHYHPVTDAKLM